MLATLQDSEVHVPRHLSAQEKARLAAEKAEEEARTRANASNDMAARALKQMMNGSLIAGQGGSAQAALARPPWMEGDPTQFTPEQQQEVQPTTPIVANFPRSLILYIYPSRHGCFHCWWEPSLALRGSVCFDSCYK